MDVLGQPQNGSDGGNWEGSFTKFGLTGLPGMPQACGRERCIMHVVRALALGLLLVAWSSPVEAGSFFNAEVIRCGVTNNGLVIVRLTDLSEFPAFEQKKISPCPIS